MQITATPEPTATPVTLSSGRTMTVSASWTHGEAWIFLAIVALVFLEIAAIVAGSVERWSR